MSGDEVDQDRIDTVLDDLEGSWVGSPSQLEYEIEFADFLTAVRFIDELAPVCEERDHHPDLTISWRTVGIVLTTHSEGGVTEADLSLARELDRIAAELPMADD
ncbi:MAG: 4a-hydroxytetrahydrobiopterin dehydratase [Jatrophihabitans sp.]